MWSGEKSSFSGRFYSFDNAEIGTRPHTPGGPPILVGGKSEVALRRTLRFARGWMGFRDDPGSIREIRDGLNQLSEQLDRDPGKLEIGTTLDVKLPASNESGSPPKEVIESLSKLERADATFCALSPMTPETLAWIGEEVAPHVP